MSAVTTTAFSTLPTLRPRRTLCTRLSALTQSAIVRGSRMVVRAQVKQGEDQTIVEPGSVDRSNIQNIEAGNLSNENAERRANAGADQPFSSIQAFDGVAPETINSRLAMVGVTSALAAEFVSGIGIKEQVATAPLSIAAVFLLISFASYIPIARGFTRKEPFANSFWSPKAENYNGRLAMVGFAAILVTEALSGKTIPEFWGLPHGKINAEIVNNAVVTVQTMNTFLTSMAPWN